MINPSLWCSAKHKLLKEMGNGLRLLNRQQFYELVLLEYLRQAKPDKDECKRIVEAISHGSGITVLTPIATPSRPVEKVVDKILTESELGQDYDAATAMTALPLGMDRFNYGDEAICPSCGTVNDSSEVKCSGCGDALTGGENQDLQYAQGTRQESVSQTVAKLLGEDN